MAKKKRYKIYNNEFDTLEKATAYVEHIQRVMSMEPASLNTLIETEAGDPVELQEFIPDNGPSVEDIVFDRLDSEQVREMLKILSPREAIVITMRYGLNDYRPKTLEEVGDYFKVTRERIRQIEAKALRKLRHTFKEKD